MNKSGSHLHKYLCFENVERWNLTEDIFNIFAELLEQNAQSAVEA